MASDKKFIELFPGLVEQWLSRFDVHIDKYKKIKELSEIDSITFREQAYIFITPLLKEKGAFLYYSEIYNYFKDNSKHVKQQSLPL